jgi:ADP-ribose pyrophosphatase YjhB (NUDIX family)
MVQETHLNRGQRGMEHGEKTNWCQSVTAVVIRDGQVLLARHTYGTGNGKLIIPGGYLNYGESPEEAVAREVFEETSVVVAPERVVGIRFNRRDWYVAFTARYVSGEAKSDGNENSEALWMDVDEALARHDVPDLTKKLIDCARSGAGFGDIPYVGSTKNGPYTLYGAK